MRSISVYYITSSTCLLIERKLDIKPTSFTSFQEKEKLKNIMPSQRNSKPEHVPNKSNQEKPKPNPTQIQSSKQKEATSTIATTQNPPLSQSSKKKDSIFAKVTMQNPNQFHSSMKKESTNATAGKNTQMTQVIAQYSYLLVLHMSYIYG